MFRVLHVMGTLDVSGISSVVLNYCTFMDRTKIHFDIAVSGIAYGKDTESFQNLGCKIYKIPLKSQGLRPYISALRKILSETHYDAVHVHEQDTSYVALFTAMMMGVPKRLAHAHSAVMVRRRRDKVRMLACRILTPLFATDLLACGTLAGEKSFGCLNMKSRRFKILPNAIDTARFAFDPIIREKMRKELGVENSFVLGIVGRLAPVKNHVFAFRLMEALKKTIPNRVLLVLGNGPMQTWLEEIVRRSNLEDTIRFLGKKQDPESYYLAFDALLMPSVYEGFPMVALEAMASGLPILFSEAVTEELSFGSAVQYLPLDNQKQWLKSLVRIRDTEKEENRVLRQYEVKDHGFDLRDTVRILEKIYGIG